MGFAVIDVETTGLRPTHDRILEIGVVLLDNRAIVQGEWSSLVNPGIPVEATFIHGITDDDVASAPPFSSLVSQVRNLLEGRAIVAHNAAFDTAFLNSAFAQVNYPVAIPSSATVCTMELSKIYLPQGRHGLTYAAQRAGLVTNQHHRALSDAYTAAKLLQHYFYCENASIRFADRAVSRNGHITLPCSWVNAQEAARHIAWIDPLF